MKVRVKPLAWFEKNCKKEFNGSENMYYHPSDHVGFNIKMSKFCDCVIDIDDDNRCKFDSRWSFYPWMYDVVNDEEDKTMSETKLPEGFVQISEEQARNMIYALTHNSLYDSESQLRLLKEQGYIRKSKLDEAKQLGGDIVSLLKLSNDETIARDVEKLMGLYEAAIAEQKAEIDRLKGK